MPLQTTGLTAAVRHWFVQNPGQHRPSEVADALGAEGQHERDSVMNLCARLARKGELVRTTEPIIEAGERSGGVFYEASDAARERVDADSRCSCCGQTLPTTVTT